MYVCVCGHVDVCVYVCVCGGMCEDVCVHVYVCVCACTHTRWDRISDVSRLIAGCPRSVSSPARKLWVSGVKVTAER